MSIKCSHPDVDRLDPETIRNVPKGYSYYLVRDGDKNAYVYGLCRGCGKWWRAPSHPDGDGRRAGVSGFRVSCNVASLELFPPAGGKMGRPLSI
ncbi:hypothetical protein M569_17067 [Genlisea aurea]|uniref:Uncharacterized protein n=1 Tax=Genlisea aurea TaxID=192259 RepID=S8BT10_9LAMI|nr:hypothetical protein M569_17067 [Genlisea aurea]